MGSSYVCAVQVARTEGHFEIEKVFCAKTRRSTDSRPEILRSLTEQHGFDKRADVAVSIATEGVFFRNFETDAAGLKTVGGTGGIDLEHSFPIPSAELVAQTCSKRRLPHRRYSLLMAATAATSVRRRLSALAAAKVHPQLLDAPICAVCSTAAANHPEITRGSAIVACLDESSLTLAVLQNMNILMVRNIRVSAGRAEGSPDQVDSAELIVNEAQLTWERVFDAEITSDDVFYLANENAATDSLAECIEQNLVCRLVRIDPYARVKDSAAYSGYAPIHIAEGLALRLLVPEMTTGVNFLDTDKVDAEPGFNLRKELLTCGVLAGLTIVVSLVGLFGRLAGLERRYGQIRKETEEVFWAAVPDETKIVDPLAQVQQKLAAMRANETLFGYISDSPVGPLDVLEAVTQSAPRQANINIESMQIMSDSVRLTGTAQSFDQVYDWQRRLQQNPQFVSLDAQPVRNESASGVVDFTLLATFGGTRE